MRGPVDPDHLPEGTLVDCWRVVRPLGGGAYGTVYLVEKDGKRYALKMARFPRLSGDARHTDERAQRELNCLLSLNHRNIVQVRFHGRWPDAETGFFYVVMDYVEGYTLAEWVERTHPTPHEVVVLFDKVLSAVAYTHAQRILHRDLKPNNILVEARTGEPVVVDFGAAHFPLPTEPRLTDTRLPPGTPRYTSPEARRFESVHRHNPQAHYEYKVADELFALGVTLFDLLTDPLHYSHPKPEPLLVLLGGAWKAPQAKEANARVPHALSQFVAHLLQPEPTQRPVSVEAARRALAELLPMQGKEWRERPVHAPVPPPSEAEQVADLAGSASHVPAAATPQEPSPVASAALIPPEVREEPPGAPVPASVEPQPSVQVSPQAPAVETPGPDAPSGPPRPRRPWSWAVGVAALMVLGLLMAWGATLRLGVTSREEPAPSRHTPEHAALRPSPSPAQALSPAPSSVTPTVPRQPLPQPLVAPPVPTLEKGTAVNIRPSPQATVPKLCAQQQLPPRGTPQWLKWCKCAAVAGSLAASQAGCPGAQVRQSLTEQCMPESVQAMEALGITFEGSFVRIAVELDVKQPSNGEGACGRDASGKIPLACIAEGPLTSRVVRSKGKLVRGTLLSGHAWFQSDGIPIYRWTEATLPDATKHPVCLEALGRTRTCPNGTHEQCAAEQVLPVRHWEYELTR